MRKTRKFSFVKKADSSRKTNPIPYETINETAFDSSLLPFAGYASSGFCLLSNTDWHSKDKASGGRIPEHPTTGKGHRNKRRTEGVRRHHEHGKHSIDCCFHQCIVCVDTSQKARNRDFNAALNNFPSLTTELEGNEAPSQPKPEIFEDLKQKRSQKKTRKRLCSTS
jgi:hypothetical protein